MKISLALFALVATIQLVVPASLIVEHELTLRRGTAYKFKTAPVDPYDAFRGRYVALQFAQREATLAKDQQFERGQKAYATLDIDPDGFAKFTAVSKQPPQDKPYLRVHVGWSNGSIVGLELPFDRFYMEEHIAPAAEQAYQDGNRRGRLNENTYALVRVRNGTGVIEDLVLNGQPIRKALRTQPAKPPR